MQKISKTQSRINRKLTARKKWLSENEPWCIFCGGLYGTDLVHKIRRSWWSSTMTKEEIQTHPLNTGLGHRNCHTIWDDQPYARMSLPMAGSIIKDMRILDPEYTSKFLMLSEK